MTTYNFSANGVDFGNYSGDTLAAAQEAFAIDAGYRSWAAMVEQAEEVSGSNNVEVREIHNHGPMGPDLAHVEARQVYKSASEILARIATRDEAGTHFTQVFSADELAPLEEQGLIAITRPTHAATGIAYSQEHWTVEVTEAGLEYLDANPTYPRINKIGEAAIRNFLIENHRVFSTRAPTASELQAWVEAAEQSIVAGNGAEIELRVGEVVLGGYREFSVPAAGLGVEGQF